MKKLIVMASLLGALFSANAQEVVFGAKAGLNLATLSGDVPEAGYKAGANLGFIAEIKVSEKFSVQPELLYSMQGSSFKMNDFFYDEESDMGFDAKVDGLIKLGYINIPVLAKYYVTPKFSVLAGPQLGVLLSSKMKIDFTADAGFGQVSGSEEIDMKEETQKIDFGANLGFAYDFTEKVFAQLSYYNGFTNVTKTTEGDDSVMKNNVIQLAVGFKF